VSADPQHENRGGPFRWFGALAWGLFAAVLLAVRNEALRGVATEVLETARQTYEATVSASTSTSLSEPNDSHDIRFTFPAYDAPWPASREIDVTGFADVAVPLVVVTLYDDDESQKRRVRVEEVRRGKDGRFVAQLPTPGASGIERRGLIVARVTAVDGRVVSEVEQRFTVSNSRGEPPK
jgi:hypothetical protein